MNMTQHSSPLMMPSSMDIMAMISYWACTATVTVCGKSSVALGLSILNKASIIGCFTACVIFQGDISIPLIVTFAL